MTEKFIYQATLNHIIPYPIITHQRWSTLNAAFVPRTARRHAPAELARFARPIPASPPSVAWNVPRNLCDVRPDSWVGQCWGMLGRIWKHMETYGRMETYWTMKIKHLMVFPLRFLGFTADFPEKQSRKLDMAKMMANGGEWLAAGGCCMFLYTALLWGIRIAI